MKNLLIIAVVFLLMACNKEKKETVDYAIISGNLGNYKDTDIALNGDRYMKFSKIIQVNEDGTFKDTLRLPKWNRNYHFYALKNWMLVHFRPGDNLVLNIDTLNVDKPVSFSGEGATYAEYLYQKNKIEEGLMPPNGGEFAYGEQKFIEVQDELKGKWLNLLDTFEGLSEEFMAQEKKEIDYQILVNYGNYDFFHARAIKQSDFQSSDGFMDKFLAFDFDNEDEYENSYYYQELVYTRLRYLKRIESIRLNSENIDYDINVLWLNTIVDNTNNETLKEKLLVGSTKDYLKSSQLSQDEKIEVYNFYTANAKDEKWISEVNAGFEEAKKLWKGSPSPKFVDYRNHAGGTMSLDDLKGKYVYIDLWATWCGPCKAEIPYLKEVEKEYHDKNIAFVSLSVDKPKDADKWFKMVNDMELTGIQLMADNEFKSDFIKSYNVNGIPRFILIDPQGNIVDQNAPRPSSKEIRPLFNSLDI